ncbi:MAG: methyl-accepting chemotaxis protein [Roseococcus sp.]|nr:methyl-accepting chemotaxis protein [Roseococcus sp.]
MNAIAPPPPAETPPASSPAATEIERLLAALESPLPFGRKAAVQRLREILAERRAPAAAPSPSPPAAAAPQGVEEETRAFETLIALLGAEAEGAVTAARVFSELRDQEARLAEISTATSQLLAAAAGMSGEAEAVARDVAQAEAESATGRATAGEALAEMRRLAAQVQDAEDKVRSMAGTLARIAETARMIEQVAAQTNLLALNATIEAARAGEAGKGFAVVASEVKNLSAQTTHATEDIRRVVAALRAEMEAVTAATGRAAGAVGAVEERIAGLAAASDRLAGAMGESARSMQRISDLLGEQRGAAEALADNVSAAAARAANVLAAAKEGVEARRASEALALRHVNALYERPIPHKVLRIARLDHLLWKKRLGDMQAGLLALRADELASDEACRLGKWYFGPASLPYRKLPAYAALAAPHKRVHTHGKAAAEAFARGDRAAVARDLDAMQQASAEVLGCLEALIAEAEKAGIRG